MTGGESAANRYAGLVYGLCFSLPSCQNGFESRSPLQGLPMFNCECCEKECRAHPSNSNRFCSRACHKQFDKDERIRKWLAGELTGNYGVSVIQTTKWVRQYVLNRANYRCERCGFNTPHPADGQTILEVNHKDGNAANTVPDNLEALCPNCHALTPTYRARNKNGNRRTTPV